MITLGITLDGEQYVWTNRKRLSSQYPYDSAAEQNDTDIKGLKKLKTTYAQLAEKGNLPLVLYYGADRTPGAVKSRGYTKDFKISDALRYCFDGVNYFRDFYDWFKNEEDMELRELRKNPQYKNLKLNCVRNAIGEMIKGYTNLRIELEPSRLLLTNEDGIDLRIDQLSGGCRAVLSVIADIAKRLSIANPDSSDPLKEEAVILIDELDLHLHPKWQKEIAGDLKRTFPNCQFMISTHSPFIIQSLDAEEVFDVKTMTFGVSLDNEN